MRRYLSLSKSNSSRREPRESIATDSEKAHLTDNVDQSTIASTVPPGVPLPGPNFKVKRVDHFYSRWSRKWKYENSGSNIVPEFRTQPSEGKDDPWQQFCFVVVREIPREEEKEPTFKVVVKSPYLLKACKDVIQEVPGLSWNAIPLELDPQLFLAFLPRFQAYRDELKAKAHISEEETHIISTVDVLVEYLRKDYRATVASIENLTSHGEITFDLLFAIMVPRSIIVRTCPITGELHALQVMAATREVFCSTNVYTLTCESFDVDDTEKPNARGFGRVQSNFMLPEFTGTVKITSLDAYPIQFHPREAEIRQSLIARGRKWSKLAGIHHMHYNGTGAFKGENGKIVKYNLNSRIMIDRANFRRLNPNYAFPVPKPEAFVSPYPIYGSSESLPNMTPRPRRARHMPPPVPYPPQPLGSNMNAFNPYGMPIQAQNNSKQEDPKLTDDELLLASPVLWGFSLSDKLWLEFNVEKVTAIEWDEEAFGNLVLPSDRKTLLQSLVEAHNAELGLDDFIKGKGRGLVVNLFGPPGVGKTLSAEATSEHVKRPLYVVGAGDLGTKASELDIELQRVFELATSWKALVLIDEADVFLEQRGLHDIRRNAMVAVFLRHLEYYPAILFLTTNRVKTFDEAFLSRIHVALHFHALSESARAQVWTAFLGKAGVKIGADGGISEEELKLLTGRDINGRQVKNATRTANSLAVSRGETLRYKHLVEVLDVMDQFSKDFQNMREES